MWQRGSSDASGTGEGRRLGGRGRPRISGSRPWRGGCPQRGGNGERAGRRLSQGGEGQYLGDQKPSGLHPGLRSRLGPSLEGSRAGFAAGEGRRPHPGVPARPHPQATRRLRAGGLPDTEGLFARRPRWLAGNPPRWAPWGCRSAVPVPTASPPRGLGECPRRARASGW